MIAELSQKSHEISKFQLGPLGGSIEFPHHGKRYRFAPDMPKAQAQVIVGWIVPFLTERNRVKG